MACVLQYKLIGMFIIQHSTRFNCSANSPYDLQLWGQQETGQN